MRPPLSLENIQSLPSLQDVVCVGTWKGKAGPWSFLLYALCRLFTMLGMPVETKSTKRSKGDF